MTEEGPYFLWEVLDDKLGNNLNDHTTGRHQIDKLVSFGHKFVCVCVCVCWWCCGGGGGEVEGREGLLENTGPGLRFFGGNGPCFWPIGTGPRAQEYCDRKQSSYTV